MGRHLTIWRDLGNGNARTEDNYGWVRSPPPSMTECGITPSQECKSMPFGHHQLYLFWDGWDHG